MSFSELIQKYDVPAPRYTSYPTVPYWSKSGMDTNLWVQDLKQTLSKPETRWSLYLHIPFCESLCTFCGCNTSITKNHTREEPYLQSILKEWSLYLEAIPELRVRSLDEIHLGGGTPTFFSPENLKKLLDPILAATHSNGMTMERSIEVDPRRTSVEHLETLRELGFTRVSMGVQDFDPEVQRLVNRVQPLEVTENLTLAARKLGFHSVNYDLIYGLPKQTLRSMDATIQETIRLRPERIALYSYAHVPWVKTVQRLFSESDLPMGIEKRNLYELARSQLLEHGYIEMGMDHFALPSDSLYQASLTGKMHRNFMGYTSRRTDVLLGLGTSAISETPSAFHQNEKALPAYETMMGVGKLTTQRGHFLNELDQRRREQILGIMCQLETELEPTQVADASEFLSEMIRDELVEIRSNKLIVKESGRAFLRNVGVFFDEHLRTQAPQTRIFSRSI